MVLAHEKKWWDRPEAIAALLMLSIAPLLWPDIPPLVDLPGHMGRYRVQLDLANSAELARYYNFEWRLIGNLGVDMLVIPLSRLFGLEFALKLIVLAIPPLTVSGFLLVSREVHGRIAPTALFTAPIAYCYPFMFGFLNFALSIALAFLAFALWIRLGRTNRIGLRIAIFVPISLLIWVTHVFGWGILGLLAFSSELVRHRDQGYSFIHSVIRSAGHCTALAFPLLLMAVWRMDSDVSGYTGDWFNLPGKYEWILRILQDRWPILDILSLFVLVGVIVVALRSPKFGFSRRLALAAIVLSVTFLLLPRILLGSAYADMRIAPYALATAILAIRPSSMMSRKFAGVIVLVALAFAIVRFSANAVSFWISDREFDRELAALDHIPHGARLVSLVGTPCQNLGQVRNQHLPSMALVRRHAFANDQWVMAGAQLISIRDRRFAPFLGDPSQMVSAEPCPPENWMTIDIALERIPLDAVDYVWLIDAPPTDQRHYRHLTAIWRDGASAVYQVNRRTVGADVD